MCHFYLARCISLDRERRVGHFLAAVLDVDFVLAAIVRRVRCLKSAVSIVDHFDFARISVRSLMQCDK